MRLLVIDLELNKNLDTDEGGYTTDIIQIGAIAYDTHTKEIVNEFKEYCTLLTPMDNGELRLSKFITQLTGITEEDIANKAIPIYHAFEKLVEFAKTNKAQRVAQWGGGDLEELLLQYEDAVINAPIDQFNSSRVKYFIGEGMNNTISAITPISHKLTNPINIKHMFQLHQDSRKRQYRGGLDACIRRLGGKFVGSAHDALVDAINTAKILDLMYEEPKKDKESLVEAIRGLYRGEVIPGHSGVTEVILKKDLEKLLKEIL